jgi:tellurite resistance protein TerC
MLTLDLGVFNKRAHEISIRESTLWTFVWVTLSFLMYFFLLHNGEKIHGIYNINDLISIQSTYKQPFIINKNNFSASLESYRKTLSLEYLTGYIIELSLSADNIFVIILIFISFGVEKKLYHRVLFWGILGAIVFRFIFIFSGSFLVSKCHWVIYIFALFLVFTGIKMLFGRRKDENIIPEKHFIVRFCSKYFRTHPRYEGEKFVLKRDGKTYITPLFVVLFIIEFTDLLFAVDSIPAIFAITIDPYIVFFSNVFAILGLRSMFFLLHNIIGRFYLFKYGLALVLIFVGVKMFFAEQLKEIGMTTFHSLMIIVSILVLSMIASLLFTKKN